MRRGGHNIHPPSLALAEVANSSYSVGPLFLNWTLYRIQYILME